MKKNKIIILAVMCLSLIILSGCGPAGPKLVRVHEGTEGFVIEFLEKSPPDEVYVGDTFPVTVDIKNKGAFDIDGGIYTLGVERGYVTIKQGEDSLDALVTRFSLSGRSTYDPIGGFDRITMELRAKSLDPQSETHTTLITMAACYPYRTEATAQVCVDTDIHGQRQAEKVCTPSMLKMGTIDRDGQELPSGQGAPIAITKIEQKMLPHEREDLVKPQYMIYVRNMGNGLPVEISNYENACKATGIAKGSLNVLSANVYLSDRSVQLDCKPKLLGSEEKTGHLKLEKQEDFIKCTLEEGIPKSYGNYNTPLMIDLDYGYTFTISKNVLIRKQV